MQTTGSLMRPMARLHRLAQELTRSQIDTLCVASKLSVTHSVIIANADH